VMMLGSLICSAAEFDKEGMDRHCAAYLWHSGSAETQPYREHFARTLVACTRARPVNRVVGRKPVCRWCGCLTVPKIKPKLNLAVCCSKNHRMHPRAL